MATTSVPGLEAQAARGSTVKQLDEAIAILEDRFGPGSKEAMDPTLIAAALMALATNWQTVMLKR
jgi:hypothetical protein